MTNFEAKKPFQVYQIAHDGFLENLKENSLGPACILYACEDLNGEVLVYVDGPKDRLKNLLKELNQFMERQNA